MNVEIGTETLIFLFWEYLFRNFGVLSLQCASPQSYFKAWGISQGLPGWRISLFLDKFVNTSGKFANPHDISGISGIIFTIIL
jgi:hypothetical protein